VSESKPGLSDLHLNGCIIESLSVTAMRTTVTIDDALCARALEMADPAMDKANLFREAVETFVRVRAAKRLAAPGSAAPKMKIVPRRQPRPRTTHS
jgi:Arc/MetJ family transcription regulator